MRGRYPSIGITCWPSSESTTNMNTSKVAHLGLTDAEEAALLSFIQTLTDGTHVARIGAGPRRRMGLLSRHLGVATTWGTPPGTIIVLVPLPLFMSRPCAALPGSVVVCIEPMLPVMKAGPLDVWIALPRAVPGELRNEPAAHASPAAPATSEAVRTATVLQVLTIDVSVFI